MPEQFGTPRSTNCDTLADRLYEEPVEYYKEAARFIRKVGAAYEASKTGDPSDKDAQHENLLMLAAEVREAIDDIWK